MRAGLAFYCSSSTSSFSTFCGSQDTNTHVLPSPDFSIFPSKFPVWAPRARCEESKAVTLNHTLLPCKSSPQLFVTLTSACTPESLSTSLLRSTANLRQLSAAATVATASTAHNANHHAVFILPPPNPVHRSSISKRCRTPDGGYQAHSRRRPARELRPVPPCSRKRLVQLRHASAFDTADTGELWSCPQMYRGQPSCR